MRDLALTSSCLPLSLLLKKLKTWSFTKNRTQDLLHGNNSTSTGPVSPHVFNCAKLCMSTIMCDSIRSAIAPAHFSPGPGQMWLELLPANTGHLFYEWVTLYHSDKTKGGAQLCSLSFNVMAKAVLLRYYVFP